MWESVLFFIGYFLHIPSDNVKVIEAELEKLKKEAKEAKKQRSDHQMTSSVNLIVEGKRKRMPSTRYSSSPNCANDSKIKKEPGVERFTSQESICGRESKKLKTLVSSFIEI